MAGRPLKQGLDYFSLDVDFFQSAKVRRIIKACGVKAVSVLICLLANIYRKDGYFLKWDGDMAFLVADEIGAGMANAEAMVTDVLQKALSADFFDAGIFEEYGVLTSEGIQERFFTASERRKRIEIIQEIFLLNPSEVQKNAVWKSTTTMPFFKKKRDFGINVDNNSINVSKNSINVDTNEQSKGKESKGKGSKVEESKEAINVDNNSIIADKNSNNVDNNSIYVGNNGVNVNNNSSTTFSQAVLDVYQREIRPMLSDVEIEKLADDVARYGEPTVIKAIQRAAIRNKRSIGYVEGILRKWEVNGYDEEGSSNRPKENPQIAMARQAVDMLRGENKE